MQRARSDAGSAYQYRYFGGFRLMLAMLVMLQHFAADLAPMPLALAMAPFAAGSMAVRVFFALSGFVITEAVDCVYRDRPGAFLANRLLRIGPHFVLALALSMLAHEFFRLAGGEHLWRSQPDFPPDAFAINNVLLNFLGIIPGADHRISYNFLDITWAVRVEMAFYLAMFGCVAIGRRLSSPRGFARLACGLSVLLLPAFWYASQGRGVMILAHMPFFVFGSALYFATRGSRAGWLITALSILGILWQYWCYQARAVSWQGLPSSPIGNLVILAVLLGVMTILAFVRIDRGRGADQVMGNLTYPLYLYHEVVLIVLVTLIPSYSYSLFATGIVLSFAVAGVLMALVDPVVTFYRDLVRGRSLRRLSTAVTATAMGAVERT